MTTSAQSTTNSYGLLRAAEAVTNWRALAMTGLAALVFFLFIALTGWMMRTNGILGAVFVLVTLIVGLIGYSAVGIVLMRQALGQSIGLADAALQALFTVHRLVCVAILLFLVFVGVALAALLILFVCKVPGLGPLLYSIAFPILAVILGMTVAGMAYVGFPLAAPSVWAGNTIYETMARLLVIMRQRLLSVITNLVILSFLAMFLFGVVAFILFSGYSITSGLSGAVGINPLHGVMGMFRSIMGGGFGGGESMYGMEQAMAYAGPIAFASGLLVTIGLIIPLLTFINGTCLIYLQTVDGLNFDVAEEQLRSHVKEAARRAQEAKDRASAKLDEARASTQQMARGAAPAPARVCASCKAPLAAEDVFCGECGAKQNT